jgi:hypothetical protein
MLGAPSAFKTDAHGLEIISQFKATVEGHSGVSYGVFEPIHYTTQVVSGTNYQAKVRVGEEEFIDFKVYQPLPGGADASVSAFKTGVTLDSAFSFQIS